MRRYAIAAAVSGLALAALLAAAAVELATAMPPRPVPYDENGRQVAAGTGFDKSADAPAPGPGVNGVYPGKGVPRSGVARLPVLLVQFPTQAGQIPAATFNAMLFSVGTYATGSLNDYFREQGLTNVTGQVVNWVTAAQPKSYYVNGMSGMLNTYPMNSQGLVREAVLAANPFINFRNFDNDGPDGIPGSLDDDGIVDCLVVVFAGYAAESYSPASPRTEIWSHYWWLSAGAGPGALTVDGVKVDPYTIQSELRGTSGNTVRDIGVYCHEYGHGLGAPDLWSTCPAALQSSFGAWNGVGAHDLMGYGGWGAGGANPDRPFHMSGFTKALVGLANVITVDIDRLNEPINAVETSRDVYWISPVPWGTGVLVDQRIGSPTWNVQPWGLQGWFVENRQQIGFDSGLPGSGLLVYHYHGLVAGQDYDSDGYNNYFDNAFEWSETQPLLRLECPDQTGADHALDNDDLAAQNNLGDAGDYWSAATATTFDLTTVPSSVPYSAPGGFTLMASQFAMANVGLSGLVVNADLIVGLTGGPNHDVWIKDCLADDGSVPSYFNCGMPGPSGFNDSPDIWIDNNFDGIADAPVTNNAWNYFFAKVRNRGSSAAPLTTVRFYDLSGFGMAPPRPYPTPQLNASWAASLISANPVFAFGPGDSATTWFCTYLGTATTQYPPTLGVYVSTATDTAGWSGDVAWENNVAVCSGRSFYFKAGLPMKSAGPSLAGRRDDPEALPITQVIPVNNPDDYPREITVDVAMDLPPDWVPEITGPDGLPVVLPLVLMLDPLQIFELTLRVDPGPYAYQGQSGSVRFTEYASALYPSPEGVLGSMLLPLAVDVRAPAPVANLTCRLVDHPPCIPPAVSAHLTWDPSLYDNSGELDPPACYLVYRLDEPLLPLPPENQIATVTHDGIEETGCWDFSDDAVCAGGEDCDVDAICYAVVAVDKAGNASDVLEFVWPTQVPGGDDPLPRRLTIHQNRPNPFNPRTLVLYATPSVGHVRLSIYDVRGRLVTVLVDGPLPAGEHETAWDGRDAGGRAVPGGVYFARVAADGQTTTCKMTLVK